MPAAPTSAPQHKPAPSSSAGRRRVVDVVARHYAQALAVTTAGDIAAIHCHTSHGTVVITASLALFVQALRGPFDSNGRPIEHGRAARVASQDELDAAALPPPRKGQVGVGKRRLSPEREALLRALWARRIGGEPVVALATEAKCSTDTLYLWFKHFQAADLAASTRPPALKPSGKLL